MNLSFLCKYKKQLLSSNKHDKLFISSEVLASVFVFRLGIGFNN
jgi:hypothetical protein